MLLQTAIQFRQRLHIMNHNHWSIITHQPDKMKAKANFKQGSPRMHFNKTVKSLCNRTRELKTMVQNY